MRHDKPQRYLPSLLKAEGILSSLNAIERTNLHGQFLVQLGHGVDALQPIVGGGAGPRPHADAANSRYQIGWLHQRQSAGRAVLHFSRCDVEREFVLRQGEEGWFQNAVLFMYYGVDISGESHETRRRN